VTPGLEIPVVARAARGELPAWARAKKKRRAHIERVRQLVQVWARDLELDAGERDRWTAVATLHDALRDADPEMLRPQVPADLRALPASLLHGPAAAARLAEEGVEDEALLRAVAFHSIGHPGLDAAGHALFAADALEPGRGYRPAWRARLRAGFPTDPSGVVHEVLAYRLGRALEVGHRIRGETVAFWNTLVESSRGDAP
jgi:HD superfamily phosphohydrolase YqeK